MPRTIDARRYPGEQVVVPSILEGKRVCVCGHENNLRSLLKYIDGVSNEVRNLFPWGGAGPQRLGPSPDHDDAERQRCGKM